MAHAYSHDKWLDEDGEETCWANPGTILCDACADGMPHMDYQGPDDDEGLDGIPCADCDTVLGPKGGMEMTSKDAAARVKTIDAQERGAIGLVFKDEDDLPTGTIIGPLFYLMRDGSRDPYEIGNDGLARWYTRTQARALASEIGLPLEEE